MNIIFALSGALFGITLVFGGIVWLCALAVLVFADGVVTDPLMGPVVIGTLVGLPALLFVITIPMRLIARSNKNKVEILINELIDGHPNLGMEKRGPLVVSTQQPTGMAFYADNQVILASARGGEHYAERFDIDELGWREIRNSRGEYLGVEAFPPANARPSAGTLKIWSGWNIPGEARAIYGTNGIPLP